MNYWEAIKEARRGKRVQRTDDGYKARWSTHSRFVWAENEYDVPPTAHNLDTEWKVVEEWEDATHDEAMMALEEGKKVRTCWQAGNQWIEVEESCGHVVTPVGTQIPMGVWRQWQILK